VLIAAINEAPQTAAGKLGILFMKCPHRNGFLSDDT